MLRPFEGSFQVFRLILCFWNMSEVVYEKNGLLLLFNVTFFYILRYILTKGPLTPNSDPIAGFVLGFCTDHSYLDLVD